jgi:ubiquinone biosynthesis protein UbiJ
MLMRGSEDAKRYIAHLVGQVITVSIATVQLVNELAQAVRCEDWLSEAMG